METVYPKGSLEIPLKGEEISDGVNVLWIIV